MEEIENITTEERSKFNSIMVPPVDDEFRLIISQIVMFSVIQQSVIICNLYK
jgi:hypothetical protein